MSGSAFVVFRVDDVQYGVPVSEVQSVEQVVAVTPVPRTLPIIRGVFEIRGKIAPLLDVRTRLHGGFASESVLEDTYVLIIEAGGMDAGFVVDEVNDVVQIEDNMIHPTPELVGGVRAEYMRGVVHREGGLLILLDLPKLLVSAEIEQLQSLSKDVEGSKVH